MVDETRKVEGLGAGLELGARGRQGDARPPRTRRDRNELVVLPRIPRLGIIHERCAHRQRDHCDEGGDDELLALVLEHSGDPSEALERTFHLEQREDAQQPDEREASVVVVPRRGEVDDEGHDRHQVDQRQRPRRPVQPAAILGSLGTAPEAKRVFEREGHHREPLQLYVEGLERRVARLKLGVCVDDDTRHVHHDQKHDERAERCGWPPVPPALSDGVGPLAQRRAALRRMRQELCVDVRGRSRSWKKERAHAARELQGAAVFNTHASRENKSSLRAKRLPAARPPPERARARPPPHRSRSSTGLAKKGAVSV